MDIDEPEQKVVLKPFQKSGRHFFLTYAQCPITLDDIRKHLNTKVDMIEYVIAQEPHKDGNPHLHCYFKVRKRKTIHNSHYFDVSVGDNLYQPDIQVCRNHYAVINYCQKEGQYISTLGNFSSVYDRSLAMAKNGDIDEAMKQLPSRDIVMKGNDIRNNLQSLLPPNQENLFELSDFIIPEGIQKWNKSSKKRCLWIYGPSGVGKTQLIKAMYPNCLFVSHKDKLKQLKPEHELIVFDDMSFSHWPREAVIHLLDTESSRDIDVKFGMVTIPMNTPRVFLSNNWIWPKDDTQAIKRRLYVVTVNSNLFEVNQNEKEDSLSEGEYDYVPQPDDSCNNWFTN